MKSRLAVRPFKANLLSTALSAPLSTRPSSFHTNSHLQANPLPITAAGPPPSAPLPAASQYGEQVERKRKQAALVQQGQELRNAKNAKPATAMRKRFWKDVSVKKDEANNHIIHLDTRPVRNPTTRTPLLVPPSKPHLATAIALEWDSLASAQQALRSHLIPLTSLASRAQALALEDAQNLSGKTSSNPSGEVLGGAGEGIRYEIINMLLRYLDTDTLLCWAPPSSSSSSSSASDPDSQDSLRALQIQTATPILAYLSQHLWPGVEIRPALTDGSILPRSQPAATRAVIKGWLAGLPAFELVGLERAVLAGKSLCIGARLVGEWSEHLRVEGEVFSSSSRDSSGEGKGKRFGVEDAAEASNLEVRWQTGRWGEVEDSHDVDREDMARQFGSVVLLVSGETGRR